jgi:hypothetical protein
MIIWINGAFGVGKTTTARLVQRMAPRVRFWDPEQVGTMLRTVISDVVVRDFQDWSAWREVVAPQTVLSREYMEEIADGFAALSLPVFQVLLDAPLEVLRERILADPCEAALAWRYEHLGHYQAARVWMHRAADLIVDTATLSADAAAERIVRVAGLR